MVFLGWLGLVGDDSRSCQLLGLVGDDSRVMPVTVQCISVMASAPPQIIRLEPLEDLGSRDASEQALVSGGFGARGNSLSAKLSSA